MARDTSNTNDSPSQEDIAVHIKKLERQYSKLEGQTTHIRRELAKLIKKPVTMPEA